MKTRAELKEMAKQQIKGNIGILFVITLVIGAIAFVAGLLSAIPVVGVLATVIVTPALSLSIVIVYVNLVKGVKPEVKDAFAGFKDFWTAFKTTWLVSIFTALWSLLFYIPGIIKAISYSMSMLIVAENPGISAREAIKRSKEMMHGHKMEYFILGLSFIGWGLLCGITFGIAGIWVIPYMQATMVNFYNNIKPVEEAPAVEVEAEAE